MARPAPRTRRTRRPTRKMLAVAGAVALALTGLGAGPAASSSQSAQSSAQSAQSSAQSAQSAQAAQSAAIPGVDEVDSSDNMRSLANVPMRPPFDPQDAWGTDLAFKGRYAFVGNYEGFVVYDIKNPRRPRVLTQVHCPGGQGDLSVTGDLLFMSVDYPRTGDSCGAPATTPADPDGFEGMRVFDISDIRSPEYAASVPTKCGSHTHTLVPDKRGESAYVYVSSYGPSERFPDCQPPHDKISIIETPYDDPSAAKLVAEPVLFPDGGNPGQPDGISQTTGCHDITAFPEKDIAAGACMGDGVLMDISDRKQPTVIDQVQDDENFAFWHSAIFTNDASKVVFHDELGGGTSATCNEATGSTHGADGIYSIEGKGENATMEFRSYFKISRHQSDTENCVAHNGSLIPAKGRDIMVQSWYQGGISVWDFTDPESPEEIGYWERGPLSNDEAIIGGSWSAYYYNGHIYSSDIQKGLDVLHIRDPRTNSAKRVKWDEFNAQTQEVYRD